MKFISSTTALKPYADFSKVPPDVLSNATLRGSIVHRICATTAKGLWVREIPEDCAGYVKSFQDWFDKQVEEVIAVETELVDNSYGYVSHPDLIVRMKSEGIVIVDLKTPVQLAAVWRGQLASYLNNARKNGYSIEKAGSLRLDPKGGVAKMDWYDDSDRDFAAFLSALFAYRHFKKGGE